MYVDLNPIRAAMAESLEQAEHTSAYDRIHGERGKEIPAAAFELKPVSQEEVGKVLKSNTPEQVKQRKAAKRRNPTGRKIRRDSWLAPLFLKNSSTADKPEVCRSGIRASNKGFLGFSLREYLDLLRWTARQREPVEGKKVPLRLQALVSKLGIDLAMWRDLVWNFKRYFGQSCCAGSPESMSQHAHETDRQWVKGQAAIRACFTT